MTPLSEGPEPTPSEKATVLFTAAFDVWATTAQEAEAQRELLAYIAELEADRERLDAMERFARETNDGDGFSDGFAELAINTDDDDGTPLFEVNGPRTSWGHRIGEGATLRAAIDAALAWEHAPNLETLGDSEPVPAGSPGDTP